MGWLKQLMTEDALSTTSFHATDELFTPACLSIAQIKLQNPSMKQNNLPGTQPAEPEQPISRGVIPEAQLWSEDEMFHVTVTERHFALAEFLPPLPGCLFTPVPL